MALVLRQGAQPDAAFEIPAAYRHFDPLALIERIRHSDVRVAPNE